MPVVSEPPSGIIGGNSDAAGISQQEDIHNHENTEVP